MKTPQEAAKELVNEFEGQLLHREYMISGFIIPKLAKACALICVETILDLDVWDWPHNAERGKLYWLDIKNEINNL